MTVKRQKKLLLIGKSISVIIGCLIGMEIFEVFLGSLVMVELLSIYEAIKLSE